MSKLPRTSSKKILGALQKLGFNIVRRKGSHIVLRRDDKGCVLPDHDEVAVGTLRSILRQGEISIEEFMEAFTG